MRLVSQFQGGRLFGLAILLMMAALPSAPRASAASYAFTTFNIPGATQTYYSGINNAGEIVGSFVDAASASHSFIQSGATYTTIDVPGASETIATAVNNADQIVGYFVDSIGAHGFVFDGTNYTSFDVPNINPPDTQPLGINDAGEIVGVSYDSVGRHSFIKEGEAYTMLDHGTAEIPMFALGLNDAGLVVGQFFDSSLVSHGFVYDGTTYIPLDAPGAIAEFDESVTAAYGINSAGEIVGVFNNGRSGGWLRSGTTYTEFDVPGFWASGINDSHQIVGYVGTVGFLATPISLETQIALRGSSLVEATVFGSATTDVTTLDPTSMRLGPHQAVPDPDFSNPALIEDVNGDGVPDLVVLFRAQDTGLWLPPSAGSQTCFTASLSGQTILSCDPIAELPSCGLGGELALALPALLWLQRARWRSRPGAG